MHILHQKTVVAYLCGAFGGCAAGDVDILAETVVVAYFTYRVLTLELQVLGLGRNAAASKKFIVRTNTGTIVYRHAVLQKVVVAYHSVAVDIAKWANSVVVAYLGLGVDKCPIADFIHR